MCRQDVRFREALPVGFAEQDGISDALQAQFGELVEVFSDSTRLEAVMNRLAERFITSRLPLLDGQLLELRNVERLDVRTTVRKRTGIMARLTADDRSVNLLFPGKKITFPKYGEPLLRFIVETSEFNVASMPGNIDVDEKLGLVRRLIREGFLTTVREYQQASI